MKKSRFLRFSFYFITIFRHFVESLYIFLFSLYCWLAQWANVRNLTAERKHKISGKCIYENRPSNGTWLFHLGIYNNVTHDSVPCLGSMAWIFFFNLFYDSSTLKSIKNVQHFRVAFYAPTKKENDKQLKKTKKPESEENVKARHGIRCCSHIFQHLFKSLCSFFEFNSHLSVFGSKKNCFRFVER